MMLRVRTCVQNVQCSCTTADSHKWKTGASLLAQAGLQEERRAWEDDLYDLGTLLRLADTVHENGDAPADGGGAVRSAPGPDGHPFSSLAAQTLV